MARYNLGTVISFEVTRTLTKRRFWIATLIVPVFLGVVIGLVVSANTRTASQADLQRNASFTFTYSDASGYVNPAVVSALGGREVTDQPRAIEEVRLGKVDAYFAYPS